ncbi:threonine-phosphate decarboxylase CobD [Oxalicibacterium solurbis]|uniref:threonine-phosphate decarboxylase n=1 Tax=Oxalicibacterium solurbis TaxID=69280 RepID=A0A8J3F4A8_9BURK|nr:threonine-phosphate decarboxylase CobD [Oxalicibacterium solurbis]GGI54347.1 threonine-phosphate decarboxylase [Oxalicibacterium solurbis]
MLDHGGNLDDAVRRYGRPREAWLDLSTGINPHSYPVPALAADVWHRLPETDVLLLQAAEKYYGASPLLAVAGTQAAIQALPRLRGPSRVTVPSIAYAEHAHHWKQNGHTVRELPYAELASVVDDCDVMVVCNPNNPTGESVAPAILRDWAKRLAARGGWLIVDEAFGDVTPELSIAALTASAASAEFPGLIVLRSIGKFFGLAGLRLGFVAAEADLLARLRDMLGPWTVSGPAQQIGTAALTDTAWQSQMCDRLREEGARLHALLASHGIAANGCALYQYWPEKHAADFADRMARHGIWIRQFTHGVRLGLPPDEAGWQRLQHALADWQSSQGNA